MSLFLSSKTAQMKRTCSRPENANNFTSMLEVK